MTVDTEAGHIAIGGTGGDMKNVIRIYDLQVRAIVFWFWGNGWSIIKKATENKNEMFFGNVLPCYHKRLWSLPSQTYKIGGTSTKQEADSLLCLFLVIKLNLFSRHNLQWRIQDFPEEGAPTLKEVIIWPISPKTAWNWKNLDSQGGVPGAPLRSANGLYNIITLQYTVENLGFLMERQPRGGPQRGRGSSIGSSGRVGGRGKKHEIYVAAFGGHLFYELFVQGWGVMAPRPPWIRYWEGYA